MPLSRFDNGKRVAGMSDGLPVDVALEDRDVYAFLHMDSPFVGTKKKHGRIRAKEKRQAAKRCLS